MGRFLVLTVVVALSLPCVVRAEDAKLPVPDDAAQKEVLALIKEIYGEKWADAKTDQQKQALAKELLAKAAESPNTTNKYVLLRVARDTAKQGGDSLIAYQAIDQMGRMFQVDALTMKASVLNSLANKARLPKEHKAVAEKSLALAEDAAAQDDYDIAIKLADLAFEAARKVRREGEWVKTVLARREALLELAETYAEVRKAEKVLEENPTDPDANLVVGKYQCLVKGNWDKGLPMLALGSDATLKALAAKELGEASEATEQVAMGDAWWDLAEKKETKAKKRLQERAAYWYRKALPGLTGLVKDKIEKRMKEPRGAVPGQSLKGLLVSTVWIREGQHKNRERSKYYFTFDPSGTCSGKSSGQPDSSWQRWRVEGDVLFVFQPKEVIQLKYDARNRRFSATSKYSKYVMYPAERP